MSLKYYLWFLISVLGFQMKVYSQDSSNYCLKGQTFHIVVIGSSTAAGSGPNSSDSTWVNRFRKYVQSINKGNTVTNLAIGGTTTYHILPDWFVAPSGRPQTNTKNNISEAIRLKADAVVLNMPSNDASKGYGLNEQMSNFHSIVNSADSVGVPVWVCTTQPKTTSNTTLKQTQVLVRDSILAVFGKMSVDFWTTIADTSNQIEKKYDSGDGTHLNDAAHGILFNRVVSKNILSQVFDTILSPDFGVVDFRLINQNECGSDSNLFEAVICNYGIKANSSFNMIGRFRIHNQTTSKSELYKDTIIGINTCELDTIRVISSTSEQGNYNSNFFIVHGQDTNKSNDSASFSFNSIGWPKLILNHDTGCVNEVFHLSAFASKEDSIKWINRTGKVIDSGNYHLTQPLTSSDYYFVQASRGKRFYESSIQTSQIGNVHWNGTMFDIIAHEDLIIDSLLTKINTLGGQAVEAYYKKSSHRSSINTKSDWTYWGSSNINVNKAGELKMLKYNSQAVKKGDTLGVYLHLNNSAGQLTYNRINGPTIRSNTQLSILTGTGISYSFSGNYYPRDWNGEVFYHYGSKPNGACQVTSKILAYVDIPVVNLGNDTVLIEGQFLVLSAPSNFIKYLWSDSSTNSYVLVDSSAFKKGKHKIWVRGNNKYDCWGSDTIEVDIIQDPTLNLSNILKEEKVKIYPNPTKGIVFYDLHGFKGKSVNVSVFNALGEEIKNDFLIDVTSETGELNMELMESGWYLIKVSSINEFVTFKLKVIR